MSRLNLNDDYDDPMDTSNILRRNLELMQNENGEYVIQVTRKKK